MYAVFVQKLVLDKDQEIVRKHAIKKDAFQIWQELSSEMQTSTTAQVESDWIMTYLTTSKITNGVWRGTHEGYIINWLE